MTPDPHAPRPPRSASPSFEHVPLNDIELDDTAWYARHQPADIRGHEPLVAAFIRELASPDIPLTDKRFHRQMRQYRQLGLPSLTKHQLLHAYRDLCRQDYLIYDPAVITRLQIKPTRSQAGVAVVTVLTKPYPCPGQCIFCPTDVRMPKSYLRDEPGAQRAERLNFDPYAQTAQRLEALENIGHPTDKIELLILGGTWSSYRRDYQAWFIKRCFDALNQIEAHDLTEAQTLNVHAERRNVGLVIETRPDHINADELRWLRSLGVTKVQIGIQSLDDRVLTLNQRGHTVQATREAFRLLRLAGFKIHGHWMPNLLGATPESDVADYARLWDDPAIRPDELKIYPCMLLENADLYAFWQRGEYQPYTEEQVVDIVARCKLQTPRYARLTRVVRDIPTTNVVAGFTKANLRQVAQARLQAQGLRCRCIRCREIRRAAVPEQELALHRLTYATDATTEQFVSYDTADDRLAGFLRLSLPSPGVTLPLPELAGHAMIREVHIYGPALPLGQENQGEAQHRGLGARLIDEACRLAREAGYTRLAVISAVGTQAYYARHGFVSDGLYMTRAL